MILVEILFKMLSYIKKIINKMFTKIQMNDEFQCIYIHVFIISYLYLNVLKLNLIYMNN